MNITHQTVYWITRLDIITEFIEIAGVLGLIFVVIIGVFWLMATCAGEKDIAGVLKRAIWSLGAVTLLMMLLNAFIPSTKEMAAILVLPEIVGGDFVNGTLPTETRELYDLMKGWLKEKAATPTGNKK